MLAVQIMTDKVWTVDPQASLQQLAELLLERRVGGVPVVTKDGHLVGMVTEADLLRRPEIDTQPQRSSWLNIFTTAGHLAEEYVKTRGRRVEEIMSQHVVSVRPDMSVAKVVAEMERVGVRRVPVVLDEKLVGIITRRDIVQALAKELCDTQETQDDKDIVKAIRKQINDADWGPLPYVYIAARQGDVTLSGIVTDSRLQRAAIVAAENVSGVRKVIDEIRCVEPVSFGY